MGTARTLRLLRQTIEELVTDLEEYLRENDNNIESLKIAIWVEEEDAQSGQKLYWRDKLKKQATEDWMSKTYIPVATLVVAFSADYLLKGTQEWLNVSQIALTTGAAIVALILYVIIKVAFYTDDYVYKDSGS